MERTGWICTAIRSRTRDGLARARAALPGQWIGDTWDDAAPWPETGLIVVTVPDREIVRVGERLGRDDAPWAPVVLHTSGFRPSADLGACRTRGMDVGSWHPLQTFPRYAMPPEVFREIHCAIEGDPVATGVGTELAHNLGMHAWFIDPDSKPLYHAAAAVAANLPHILIVAAKRCLIEAGFDPAAAGSALATMVHASVTAALEAQAFEALTGPVSRGDWATVAAHRASLPVPLADVYAAIVRLVED